MSQFKSLAAILGSTPPAGSSGNNNRVTMNAIATFANFAKGFNWTVPPANADANGNPTGTLSSNINCNPGFAPGYFGDYVWKWSGTGSMQVAQSILVRSTSSPGIFTGLAGSSGDIEYNATLANQTNPRIVFTFGVLIEGVSDSGISNGAGGTYIKITSKSGYFNQVSSGTQISIQDSSLNGSIVGQRNAIGVWNYTKIDSSNIYLTTNTSTGAVSAYASGSPWSSGGEGITPASNLAIYLMSGTYTGFSDLVFCKTTNETAVDGGQINDPDYVNQIKYLMNHASAPVANRGWLRFMDLSGVQGSYECDFVNRRPSSYFSYAGGYFPQAYWAGSIASADGTTFTCNSGRIGAYQDLEIVQGTFSAANSSVLPTLNDNGRGAMPIFDASSHPMLIEILSAPTAAGQNLVFSFQAPWLNGGTAYTFTYTTTTTGPNGSDLSGTGTFSNNLHSALLADATLSAALLRWDFAYGSGMTIYPRTAQAGALTVTYTSGPSVVEMLRIASNSFVNGANATFYYSQILGGWIWAGADAGLQTSYPYEMFVELCNQTGSHCWFNWPVHTKSTFITDVTDFFADSTTGLTSGLRFGTEVGNELWNFGERPFGFCEYLGYAMGFTTGSECPQWGWGALRTMQYMPLSQAAWTGKGRALSDHYIFQIGRWAEQFTNQNFEINGLKGTPLTTTNAIYAAYGGLGGGAASDYSTSPNRPVDHITATGVAAYWYDDYIGQTVSSITGTTAENASWLQAANDYANGNTATAFAALVTQFDTSRTGSGQAANWVNQATLFTYEESVISAYDGSAGRTANGVNAKIGILHYEGAPQWSFSSSSINGTNSVSDSTSLTQLQDRITALSWDVSAYTLSGTNSASEMAQMCINLIMGWKFDLAGLSPSSAGSAANTGSYKNMIKTYYYQALVNASTSSGREVKPAQYGYEANIWGLFPVNYEAGNQYGSYDAIHEFNQ